MDGWGHVPKGGAAIESQGEPWVFHKYPWFPTLYLRVSPREAAEHKVVLSPRVHESFLLNDINLIVLVLFLVAGTKYPSKAILERKGLLRRTAQGYSPPQRGNYSSSSFRGRVPGILLQKQKNHNAMQDSA